MSIFDDVLAAFSAPTANLLTAFSPSTTPTNNPSTDATTAGTAIRSALLQGYSVAIFTSTNSAWPVPSIFSEATGIVINGGGKGGTATTSAGGIGAINGGYLVSVLDISALTPGVSTLNIVVGAAAASAGTAPNPGAGGVSSINFGATVLLQGVAGASGMATKEGYSVSTSTPGDGGDGGYSASAGTAASGTAGGSSAIAAGGVAGVGFGNVSTNSTINGGNGVAGSSAAIPLCGGGGGGGGGNHQRGSALLSAVGGNGGNGGFPGGASGGGGNATSGAGRTQGVGGTPGNGLCALIYK